MIIIFNIFQNCFSTWFHNIVQYEAFQKIVQTLNFVQVELKILRYSQYMFFSWFQHGFQHGSYEVHNSSC